MSQDIQAWLAGLGLDRYGEAFSDNDIDLELIVDLDEDDLEKLGVVSMGHRKKLLRAILALKDGAGAAPAALFADPADAPEASVPDPDAAPTPIPAPIDLAPGAERRQLTVMFCDLVGSTELSTRLDPEDLSVVLHAYQDACAAVIAHYQGYIAKYMGDGVLVYFGYPQAQERDAESAVRAALDIVAGMRRLNAEIELPSGVELAVRIGIDTGLVVVGELVGEGDARERAVVGETPNVAARLQAIAAPNGIVIGSVTRDLAGHGFDFEDLGARSMKGIAGFVKAWSVQGLRHEEPEPAPSDAETSTAALPLIGRDEEIGLLRRAWQQVRSEGRGQAVLITGEPGIGKTALIETLGGEARNAGQARIVLRCSPYNTGSALLPVIEHLRRLWQWQPEDSAETRLAKMEATLSKTSLPLAEAVPLLAALMSLPVPEDRYPPLDLLPQQQRQQTLDTMIAWILEEAEQQPLLMLCEDVHWADASTLEFLGQHLDQAPTVPMLMIVTTRPDFQPPWPQRSHVTPITLARLERPQTEALITRYANGKLLPAEVMQHIVSKTDGVPLYVEELTKAVLASDALREERDRYTLAGSLANVSIPATLQESLMARLDRFPKLREVAQLGAVLGREFAYEMLHALVDVEEPQLQDGLDRLVDAELLYQRGRPPRARYIFKHALVQDAAYESLLRRTRQHYHSQVADLIADRFPETVETRPEVVAHHYHEAGRFAEALELWERAGTRALEGFANAEAIVHLTAALELIAGLPDDSIRARRELNLRIKLAGCLAATEGYAAARTAECYTRARELCERVGERGDWFSVLRGLWVYRLVRGELDLARALAEESAGLAEGSDDPAVAVEGYHALGGTQICEGAFAEARRNLDRSIALYDPQHSSRDFIHDTLVGILPRCFAAHTLWHLGFADQAVARMQDALAVARQLSHPFAIALALDYAAMLYQFRREPEAAQDWADQAIALCEERGFAYYLAWGRIIRGWSLVENGGGPDHVAQMRAGLDALRATGAALRLPYYLGTIGEASGKAGLGDEGLVLVDEALGAAASNGENWHVAELRRAKGTLLLARGPAAAGEAEACLRTALGLAHAQEAMALKLRTATSLARLWRDQDRPAEARDLLAPVHAWFTEGFETPDMQAASTLLAELG